MESDLHIEALAWLRYVKQLPLVATEVGRWYADVLGVGPKYSIEVEVKKSIGDFQADFRNKRNKHWYYARSAGGDGPGSWKGGGGVPNYMYFLVPASLKDKALRVLEARTENELEHESAAASYGLLAVGDWNASTGYGAGKTVEVVRRAKRLHGRTPSDTLVREVTRRLSSELVGLYQHHRVLETRLLDDLRGIREDLRAAAAAVAAFTPEPPDPSYDEEEIPRPPPGACCEEVR